MKQASLMKSLLYGAASTKQGATHLTAGGHKFYIDTCYAYDVESYETCVFTDGDTGCNVEHYDTKAAAVKGHKKWVASLKKNPNQVLIEQNEYGF